MSDTELNVTPEPTPPPSELKGEALAAALDNAGLPKTGTADEKRASLAEAEPESEEFVNPGLAMAAPAYNPPADFEHTAYSPENVQHIS